MIKIFDDLYLIDGIGESHVFLPGSPEGYCLIESGIFKRTRTIFLARVHRDHIGGA